MPVQKVNASFVASEERDVPIWSMIEVMWRMLKTHSLYGLIVFAVLFDFHI